MCREDIGYILLLILNYLQKLNCFLFDKGFLVTRPSKTELKYTVCHQLIPAYELEVDEVEPLRSRHCKFWQKILIATIHRYAIFTGFIQKIKKYLL
jgi:hypothetical protein